MAGLHGVRQVGGCVTPTPEVPISLLQGRSVEGTDRREMERAALEKRDTL